MPKLSIIIPVLNEESLITGQLQKLQDLREGGHELIVVDGGSRDRTPELAAPLSDHVLHSKPGRAVQMNAGAEVASGDIVLFLHADTQLPASAPAELDQQFRVPGFLWGRFDVRFTGSSPLLGMVAFSMNLRSHVTGVATGDQAIFVDRLGFLQCGGFAAIPLMEDIELSKRLRHRAWPRRINTRVLVSSRRWERDGIIRTIALMWWLRLLYFLGTPTSMLSRIYYK